MSGLREAVERQDVQMAAAEAVLSERRNRWEAPHQGHCILDARAALRGAVAFLDEDPATPAEPEPDAGDVEALAQAIAEISRQGQEIVRLNIAVAKARRAAGEQIARRLRESRMYDLRDAEVAARIAREVTR